MEKIRVRSWQRSATIGLLRAQIEAYKEMIYLETLIKSVLNVDSLPDTFSDLIYCSEGDAESIVDNFLDVA